MNPASHKTLVVAGAALVALGLIWILVRYLRSRRKSPEEIERLRRLDLNRRGRITSGQISDFFEPAAGQTGPRLIVYKYAVSGVDYEVAQDLTSLPYAYALAKRMAGRTTSLKYDTKRPTNSIIACEEWIGIPKPQSGQRGQSGGTETSSKAGEKAGEPETG